MKTHIKNIRIVLENSIIENGSIAFENGKIVEIHSAPTQPDAHATVVDGSGLTAVPGYIDTHCHGGGGYDCNDSRLEDIEGMTAFYARHGITSYYPSLAADRMDLLVKGFDAIRAAMRLNKAGKPEVLGTHLEGPFLNKMYKGSQAEKSIIPLEAKHLELIASYTDVIKRITIAPEVDNNVDLFPQLVKMGLVITGGHSNATYAEVEKAVQNGMAGVTHLYNAMSQTRKQGAFRVCGMLEAGQNIDALYTEIIADGYHLPDPLIQITYRCKGGDKMVACSDANRAAGCADGEKIHTCGQVFWIDNGIALNEDRTSLASSITPIDEMVRKLILNVKIPMVDAIKMASTNPAKMMKVNDRKGSIAVGMDADLNLLDNSYKVVQTFCKGVQSYKA